jgi:hypothetical protein
VSNVQVKYGLFEKLKKKYTKTGTIGIVGARR